MGMLHEQWRSDTARGDADPAERYLAEIALGGCGCWSSKDILTDEQKRQSLPTRYELLGHTNYHSMRGQVGCHPQYARHDLGRLPGPRSDADKPIHTGCQRRSGGTVGRNSRCEAEFQVQVMLVLG